MKNWDTRSPLPAVGGYTNGSKHLTRNTINP